METSDLYNCAIVGGGLTGLSLAIQLADAGRSVILFEKNEYPFHRVCGEYISMESWDFLMSLGLPLKKMSLPFINKLGISSENGFMLNTDLHMGGFGISRFTLDHELYKIAVSKNVKVVQNCKVNTVIPGAVSEIITSTWNYRAEIVCGTYGKYTPAFIQQSNDFTPLNKTRGPNYIAVKYHIKTNLNPMRIELHNFKDGYCGISKVDKDWYCLCYLSHSDNLQDHRGNIKMMEKQVLYKNPFLKSYFTESEFINPLPLIVSNIQFSKKQTNANGIFLVGDAAGSITPLCGNGMSIGMRASKLLANELNTYIDKKNSMADVVANYHRAWNTAFNRRIKNGYYLQHLFGKNLTTHYALKTLDKFPSLTKKIISLTHGEVF